MVVRSAAHVNRKKWLTPSDCLLEGSQKEENHYENPSI
jgi:hypothetical protein